MLYRDPFCISIPRDLYENKNLSWIHKIAFVLITKQRDTPATTHEIADELGIKYSRMKEIKQELSAAGYLSRIVERGVIRYIPIDSAAILWQRFNDFRAASTEGFKTITDQDARILSERHGLDKVLYTLEVLEHTYRKSPTKKIGVPVSLLKSKLKSGVTPDKDFNRDFWIVAADRAAAVKASKRNELEKEIAAYDEQSKSDRSFKIFLGSLRPEQMRTINERARQRIKEAGIKPAFVSDHLVVIEMKKIYQEGGIFV